MKKILLFIISFSFLFPVLAQQDPQFSHNLLNQVINNPAYVGNTGKWNLSGALREQWSGVEGAPSVSVFSLDFPFRVLTTNHGLGLSFMSDNLGSSTKMKTTTIGLSYAYRTKIFNGNISFGAKVNYTNQSLKGKIFVPSGSSWDSQRDIVNEVSSDGSLSSSEVVLDFSSGIFYYNSNYYIGASVSHLLEPTVYTAKKKDGASEDVEMILSRHYYLSGGYTYRMNSNLKFIPNIYIVSDLVAYQITGNITMFVKDNYWFGTSYRQNDAIVIMAGIALESGIKIGYAYDYGISGIAKLGNGSHELMMGYSFDITLKNQKYRSIRFL